MCTYGARSSRPTPGHAGTACGRSSLPRPGVTVGSRATDDQKGPCWADKGDSLSHAVPHPAVCPPPQEAASQASSWGAADGQADHSPGRAAPLRLGVQAVKPTPVGRARSRLPWASSPLVENRSRTPAPESTPASFVLLTTSVPWEPREELGSPHSAAAGTGPGGGWEGDPSWEVAGGGGRGQDRGRGTRPRAGRWWEWAGGVQRDGAQLLQML